MAVYSIFSLRQWICTQVNRGPIAAAALVLTGKIPTNQSSILRNTRRPRHLVTQVIPERAFGWIRKISWYTYFCQTAFSLKFLPGFTSLIYVREFKIGRAS